MAPQIGDDPVVRFVRQVNSLHRAAGRASKQTLAKPHRILVIPKDVFNQSINHAATRANS
jgi:hypothetical protein